MNTKQLFLIVMLTVLAPVTANAGAGLDPSVKMLGLSPVPRGASIAAQISADPGMSVTGLRWANNDGSVVFPRISLWEGLPGVDDQALMVASATNAMGVSTEWSQVEFDTPFTTSDRDLFVVIEFPEGSQRTGDGTGGGAAIGTLIGQGGGGGWISLDGLDWGRVSASVSFQIDPVLQPGTFAMSKLGGSGANLIREEDSGIRLTTGIVTVGPNPSNPSTTVHYELESPATGEIQVFDLRGRLVYSMHLGELPAGRHTFTWDGSDSQGQVTASGVYYLRLRLGTFAETRKVTIVR